MKAFLMYPDRDFYLGRELPPNETDLAADLELDVVLRAMAGGDKFLLDVARLGLHAGLTSAEEITYRQHVLADCIAQPAVVRDLYDVAIEALAAEKKILGWIFRDSPETIVNRSRQLLEIYVDMFRRLRGIGDAHAASFGSEGFTRFFAMLSKELGDDYLAEIEAHIGELAFRRGTLISATLGKGNKGTGYTVRRQPEQSWRDRIPGMNRGRAGYSFYVAERDDTGMRTLSDLTSRGLNGAANALGQSTDHVRSFFEMLRAELGFYLGCLNLRDRLLAQGQPVCFPEAVGPPPARAEDARLSARGLYDASLALTLDDTRAIGNDLDADGKQLIMITGANHGGKSTFLRSAGLAQLMMQAGMFVAADSFTASVSTGTFTHFKREEDATMEVLAGAAGTRLADMFADTDGGAATLRLVWAHEAGKPGYIVTESEIECEQYPPLSDITPAAFVEECEIYEQFGIRPAGGKPLNRLMLPPPAVSPLSSPALPTLGHEPPQPPEEVHAPHTVGGQAFEFPFGPVRQAGMESLYYGLVTSGEEVVDLYLFTWHKHRGVEWRLRGKTLPEAIFLAERAEGLSAVALGWAFAAAAEAALGVTPSPAAARTRAVALELERLYNHAAATAALCQATGLSVGQAAAEIALERLLRVNAAAFGHRYLFGIIEPGGVSRAPDAGVLRRDLPGAYDELHRAAGALLSTNSFVDRLEACGILTAEQARRLGLVGPVARATGLATDARLASAGPYAGHPVSIVTAGRGDVFARFQVMLGETAESVRLITQFLDEGTAADRTQIPPGGGTGLGWAESPRGEALAWVALDEDGRVTRARLRPGSARNWRGFDDACRSQNVFTDIPIIEASFWLTAAGMAR